MEGTVNWKKAARETIDQALNEGRREGLEGRDLERHVRSQYPFGLRKHWPYKVWLKEIRRVFPSPTKIQSERLPLFDSHPFLVLPSSEAPGSPPI